MSDRLAPQSPALKKVPERLLTIQVPRPHAGPPSPAESLGGRVSTSPWMRRVSRGLWLHVQHQVSFLAGWERVTAREPGRLEGKGAPGQPLGGRAVCTDSLACAFILLNGCSRSSHGVTQQHGLNKTKRRSRSRPPPPPAPPGCAQGSRPCRQAWNPGLPGAHVAWTFRSAMPVQGWASAVVWTGLAVSWAMGRPLECAFSLCF